MFLEPVFQINEEGGAGGHTPSRICLHVGAEVEGVLGVNQMSLAFYCCWFWAGALDDKNAPSQIGMGRNRPLRFTPKLLTNK